MKSTLDIAGELGCKANTVAMAAFRLGIAKVGRDYLFTPEQEALVRERLYGTRGRPKGAQPWVALGITRQAYNLRMKEKVKPANKKNTKRPRGRPKGAQPWVALGISRQLWRYREKRKL